MVGFDDPDSTKRVFWVRPVTLVQGYMSVFSCKLAPRKAQVQMPSLTTAKACIYLATLSQIRIRVQVLC